MWKYNVFLLTNERTKGISLIQQKARKEKRNGWGNLGKEEICPRTTGKAKKLKILQTKLTFLKNGVSQIDYFFLIQLNGVWKDTPHFYFWLPPWPLWRRPPWKLHSGWPLRPQDNGSTPTISGGQDRKWEWPTKWVNPFRSLFLFWPGSVVTWKVLLRRDSW